MTPTPETGIGSGIDYVSSHGITIRCWEDACVVHHPLRNETHMVGLSAGTILRQLQDAGVLPLSMLAKDEEEGEAADQLAALLRQLADVGLIEPRLG